jgi:DNA-binding protein YbaB
MAKIDLDLDDLTNAALKRLVKQLLLADDGEEQKLLAAMSKKQKKGEAKNDLADLKEEGRGKAPRIEIEEDSMEDDDTEEDS